MVGLWVCVLGKKSKYMTNTFHKKKIRSFFTNYWKSREVGEFWVQLNKLWKHLEPRCVRTSSKAQRFSVLVKCQLHINSCLTNICWCCILYSLLPETNQTTNKPGTSSYSHWASEQGTLRPWSSAYQRVTASLSGPSMKPFVVDTEEGGLDPAGYIINSFITIITWCLRQEYSFWGVRPKLQMSNALFKSLMSALTSDRGAK